MLACAKVLSVRDSVYAKEKERVLRDALTKALDKHHGNRTRTALALGLDRAYLYRLIKKFGLPKK